MGIAKMTPAICPSNERCLEWAWIYLSYCLCSVKDGVSLTLGLVSVLSWGVAEVPQIITNFKEKSTEGLSVAFLTTWIVGDLFNLIGCLLEPATLPTQFYMALLYTATTVILTTQTIYYVYIYPHLKGKKFGLLHKDRKFHEEGAAAKEKLIGSSVYEKEPRSSCYQENGSSPIQKQLHQPSPPIPVAAPAISRYDSGGRDLYYKSARSLSKSPMPTAGSWLAHSRNAGRTSPTSMQDQHSLGEPLINRLIPAQSAPPSNIKALLSVVSSAVFFVCSLNLHLSMVDRHNTSSHGIVMFVGRKLLQEENVMTSMVQEGSTSGIGTILGWAMAAIYMGGRLPQICLNIRRGNVEGLNPLMFMFALIGNATYVGSILVSSMEWSKIKPNLPWLVDAGGCVILDAFILIQFVYFHYRKPEYNESRHGNHIQS